MNFDTITEELDDTFPLIMAQLGRYSGVETIRFWSVLFWRVVMDCLSRSINYYWQFDPRSVLHTLSKFSKLLYFICFVVAIFNIIAYFRVYKIAFYRFSVSILRYIYVYKPGHKYTRKETENKFLKLL